MNDAPIDATAEELPDTPSHPVPTAEPTLALAVRPGGSTELIAAENANERVAIATEIATALDAVIKKQGMRTKVGRTKHVHENGREEWVDKWHVNVEGWQTLALLLGLAVIPHEPEPIRNDDGRVKTCDYTVERFFYPKGTKAQQIKNGSAEPERVERAQITGTEGYKCRVEVFKDGVLIGAGNGRCDRTEEAWRERPEYALEGMAATRAQSRAIAATARWIVTLAGYSSTPAEEMPSTPAQGDQASPMPGWTQPASDNLSGSVRMALMFLLGDAGVVDELRGKLAADTDGELVSAVGRALVMAVGAYRAQKEAEEPASEPVQAELGAQRA